MPGRYFYDRRVVEIAKIHVHFYRGELQIIDIKRIYLEWGSLRVEKYGRGIAWLDASTPQTLLQTVNFIQAIEERPGLMSGCPEEVAYRMGFINRKRLRELSESLHRNRYGVYLESLAQEHDTSDASRLVIYMYPHGETPYPKARFS